MLGPIIRVFYYGLLAVSDGNDYFKPPRMWKNPGAVDGSPIVKQTHTRAAL